ncbi:efflux transporter outer membrane subunit [Cupriavidus pauculus]|uniref:Type I secretion system protein TolC n=1 Tax=Cupriavidus pauculus TaxID=82633 RepID=A0A2N5C6S2_9BURK|nr:efflux transporter outer membrane subunit [Cupriavidus pauculus]PLP97903.1 Type I secretion system protein TolC [Cupriavidus pauculus]
MKAAYSRRLAGRRDAGVSVVAVRLLTDLTAGLSVLLAGCLPATPYLRPAVGVPTQWQAYGQGEGQGEGHASEGQTTEGQATEPSVANSPLSDAQQPSTGCEEEAGEWWRVFGDADLTRLVGEVLAVNSQLARSAIRIHQARLQAAGTASNAFPTVSTDINAGARRVARMPVYEASYSLALSYELDIWGKLAAERGAARWHALGTEAARDGIRMTLVGDTAKHYWQIGYLNQELVRNEADLAHARRTLAIVQGQHEAGAAHGLDVLGAEQNVAAVEVRRLELLAERTQHRNDLAILLDRPPKAWPQEPRHLPDGALPAVPDVLPADLLGRRPDLREAEAALRESLAGVDKARAQLYPSISLTANAGRASSTLIGLLSNPIPGIGLGIVMPLLDWGKQQTEVGASRDEYEIRVAQFREKWYTALAEVNSALSERWKLLELDALHAGSLDRALRAEALARARFEAGLSDVRPWLEEQEKVRGLRGVLAKNQLGQLNGLVTLYKALGGGAQVSPVPQGEHAS